MLSALIVLTALAAADEGKVELKKYGPYFEKNTSGLKGDSSYLVVRDTKAFDGTFGTGFTTTKRPVTIPKDTFDGHLVVAVIKRGKAITTYSGEKATLADGVLKVEYKAEAGTPGTANFASPLVLTVPKKGITRVEFVENGKTVETVKLGK